MGAGPRPIFRLCAQARFHRVAFDVCLGAGELASVANPVQVSAQTKRKTNSRPSKPTRFGHSAKGRPDSIGTPLIFILIRPASRYSLGHRTTALTLVGGRGAFVFAFALELVFESVKKNCISPSTDGFALSSGQSFHVTLSALYCA